MKTPLIALFGFCILQIVSAIDYSKPVSEEQDFAGQLETLKQIQKEELKSCKITYGYSRQNLDLFGNRNLTIRAEKHDGYMLTYFYQLNADTDKNELKEKKVPQVVFDSRFSEAIFLAISACYEARKQNSNIFDRWIKIQIVSTNDEKRNFLIAYWGERSIR